MIDDESYRSLSLFLRERIGITLDGDKKYLLEARLEPLLERHNVPSYRDLVFRLKYTDHKTLINEVCDALTTNESLFFRDQKPFELFKTKLLPEIVRKNEDTKKVMIWSVAASTGQEAYSVSMAIDEMFLHYEDWNFRIVATDVSDLALEKAKKGVYTEFEVRRGLSDDHLRAFFTQNGRGWHIHERIKRRVEFRKFNLIEDFNHMEMFDFIFCRNVLIYFDVATKRRVVSKLAKHLKQNGYFFLGAAESMMGISDDFEKADEQTAVYRRKLYTALQ